MLVRSSLGQDSASGTPKSVTGQMAKPALTAFGKTAVCVHTIYSLVELIRVDRLSLQSTEFKLTHKALPPFQKRGCGNSSRRRSGLGNTTWHGKKGQFTQSTKLRLPTC